MKIIDSIWFTEMGSLLPIGVVLVEDELTGERKAYIGKSRGLSEEDDTRIIAERGAKLLPDTAHRIFKHLNSGVEEQG